MLAKKWSFVSWFIFQLVSLVLNYKSWSGHTQNLCVHFQYLASIHIQLCPICKRYTRIYIHNTHTHILQSLPFLWIIYFTVNEKCVLFKYHLVCDVNVCECMYVYSAHKAKNKKVNKIKESPQTNQKPARNPNGESIMNLNLELIRVVFMYGKPTANDATHVSWKQEWWINFRSRVFYVTIASVRTHIHLYLYVPYTYL